MKSFFDKIKRFLVGNRWGYIGAIILINLYAYSYNLSAYQKLAELINMQTLISSNVNSIFMVFFIRMLFTHLIEYFSSFLLERQVVHIVRGIFKNLIVKITNFKLPYFKDNSTSKINQLWYYLGSVEYLIEKIVLQVPRNLMFLTYYTYSLYTYSPKTLLFAIPSNILLVYLQQPMIQKQYEYQEERTELDLMSKNRFLETTANIEHVKLKNQQAYEVDKIINTYDRFVENKISDVGISYAMSYTSKIFNDLLTLVIYSIGFEMLSAGTMTPAELMYIGAQTYTFYFKLNELRDIYNQYNRKQSRINTIYQILTSDQLENIDSPITMVNDDLSNFDIEFKNVTFGYKKDVNILSNANFKFHDNKINLLIGPNGSGKSTIIKLLLGLYELNDTDDKNRITINNQSIKNIPKREIRNKISFVSQDPHIFDDTVMNNVCYGYGGDEQTMDVFNYSDLLDLGEWITINSNKQCGFMGKNLSGGEKKKVQLLNAICGRSNVIIFDEPSNALDKFAIKWFINFVKQLKEKFGKTVIIITHDARLIELADVMIDMDDI